MNLKKLISQRVKERHKEIVDGVLNHRQSINDIRKYDLEYEVYLRNNPSEAVDETDDSIDCIEQIANYMN